MPRARAVWGFGKRGFLLWGGDGDEAGWWQQPDLQAVCLGGKSEMGHYCEVSFWITDEPERNLTLGQEGRGPGSCCIAVDHSEEVGVIYATAGETRSYSLDVMRRVRGQALFSLFSGEPEPKVLISFNHYRDCTLAIVIKDSMSGGAEMKQRNGLDGRASGRDAKPCSLILFPGASCRISLGTPLRTRI